MDTSLSNYITELNKLSYKDQCAYITKKLISMQPDDITHFTFLKKLQIMFINLPDAFNDFIKFFSTSDNGAFNFGFNSNLFDNYFFHAIEANRIIHCLRVSQDEYMVTIPIKNNSEDIITNIKIKPYIVS